MHFCVFLMTLFLVSPVWAQDGRRHLTGDAHHPQDHAATHSENGADEVKAEDLASDCSGPIEGNSGGARCGSYTTSLPWTSITGRPDITVGTNPAELATQNYAWEVESRSINSGVSPSVRVGRNTHSLNQRAGFLELESRDGTDNRLWFNNDGGLCKSDNGDPDATDSNCEAVGVDPQIITSTFQNPSSTQFYILLRENQTIYLPVSHGTTVFDLNGFLAGFDMGSDGRGTAFPAGRINSFSFVAVAPGTTCDVTVMLRDDGTDALGGQVENISGGSATFEDTDSHTVGAGNNLDYEITTSAGCGANNYLRHLSISFNFMPG